ncbi:MAG TPA: DUF1015 domain-containing protein [Actinomycetota bacterium]
MSRISPFVGLLFDRERVGSLDLVTTPPYDVISPAERTRYLDASPHNVIRLDLGDDRPGDDEVANKYRRAARLLRAWREDGVLRPTPRPAYFPYEMRFTFHGRPRTIRGLVCRVELEDWGGSIVPHERTMRAPVEDRLRLTRAIRANLSCIHAVFPGPSAELAAYLDETASVDPAAAVVGEDGVEHRLWVRDPDPRVPAWLAEGSLMIADGHHRYTTALRYRDEMRALHGPGPWDHTMMLVVDAATQDPPVLPLHRIQLRGPVTAAGTRVRDLGEVLESVDDERLVYGLAVREGGALVHRVARLAGEPPLVCRLHDEPLAGHDDDLRFTPDPVEAEEAVRAGEAVAAYFLPATSAARIRAVVDGGGRLPQKSTFFWPKPRTGLVIRAFELAGAEEVAPITRPRPAPAS